ncbi:UDP-glucosyltransferase 2-like [Pectinophora gossypiella]|uniref:UDP-glucosyltransferase 2-like n=1 Tax=Pectinophora gossypiella TaxID=13191 RepID=UPI00214F5530|nr:UDP-glucosyltransferase 2-like [Pectinophora gossypiella]
MRAYVVLATLLAVSNHGDSARILGLFPHTGRSHQMVFEPLLETLAERGHHITSVSFFPLKNPPANYTDVTLEGISPLGLESIDLNLFENPNKLVSYLGAERLLMQIFAFHPLDEYAVTICKKLVDWPELIKALKQEYDLVIVEYFNSDCMLGLLHIYGIQAPIVALSSSGLMPWSPDRIGVSDNPAYVPLISTFFTPKMDFWQRLENTLFQIIYKYWFRSQIQLKEQEIIEKHFGKRIPDLKDLGKNLSLIMVNTHHTLNGVRPLLPGVLEVGGMHMDHSRKPIPHYIERFINESDHGVVLLSFGSLIKTSTLPKYKEEMIVNACAKLKQRVIWKYEDSKEEGTLTGNILRVRWIPQYELLQHPKVIAFVAHGGLLGMTEAVAAGKPMVVVPFFGDQPNNAAAAEARGLAKVVSYTELSEKALADAMKEAVSAEMRVNARRVSSIWRDRQADPLDTAIYWTERVIRWGKQDPLHSAARDLSYVELALLDVAAALILAIITILLVLRFILSLIPKFLGFGTKKEKLH